MLKLKHCDKLFCFVHNLITSITFPILDISLINKRDTHFRIILMNPIINAIIVIITVLSLRLTYKKLNDKSNVHKLPKPEVKSYRFLGQMLV